MREYYDIQLYQQQRRAEAEHARLVADVRRQAQPNPFLGRIGQALVTMGEAIQRHAANRVQRNRSRRAYR